MHGRSAAGRGGARAPGGGAGIKGITHFTAGVAAAACFPFAVSAGAAGNPWYFVLGGFLGLLPDTLDFKFVRYFEKRDIEIVPDPLRPDAQMVADAMALAVNRARDLGRPVRVKLNTVRLGADRWRQYTVRFDLPNRCVRVAFGPVVDTGRLPVETPPARTAESPLFAEAALDYLAETCVDIFDGPSFEMRPRADGAVRVGFLPWHRAWSHSLVIALLAGLFAAALWGAGAGAVGFLAYAAHIAVDQAGFMGSNLFYPFTRRRTPGLRWTRSSAAFANFALVWGCCLLIFWNLSRYPDPARAVNPVALFVYGLVLPALACRWRRRSASREPTAARRRAAAILAAAARTVRRRSHPS